MSRIQRSTRSAPLKVETDPATNVERPQKNETVKKSGESFRNSPAQQQAVALEAPLTPNRGTGATVKAMGELLVRAAGGDARLLDSVPGIGASLRLFAERFEAAPPEQREAIAFAALRHHAVHSDLPIPKALLKGTPAELATAYAKDLGFDGVRFDGQHVLLLSAGNEPVKLQAADRSFGAIGRAINEHRFSTATILPPHQPIAVDAPKFDVGNAHLAVHLSTLAYQPKEVVRAQLEKWGYDTSTFRWVEDKATDTQGFVVADKKGNVFPVFRGTTSGQDWKINAQTMLGSADWQPTPDFQTHRGFTKALDAVWPQMREAIQAAMRSVGPDAKVMFTGHSLGAALTQLAAVRASREGLVDGSKASIYTLGSPRVGDEAFKQELESSFPNAFRLVNYREGFFDKQDVVTQIPPKAMGFRHAGAMARLGPEQMELIERGSNNAALRALESVQTEDPTDVGDPDIEKMSPEQLQQFMQQAMGEATQVSTPAMPQDAKGAGPNAEMIPMPSVSAHSCGVYLDRIGVQTQAEPNLFG